MGDSPARPQNDSSRRLRIGAILVSIAAVAILASARTRGDDTPTRSADIDSTGEVPSVADAEPLPDTHSTPAEELDGIHFTDVSDAAGIVGKGPDPTRRGILGMDAGIAVADVNADGWMDAFVPGIGGPNRLYINDGHGAFVERAAELGLAGSPDNSNAAAAFADINGDQRLDLFVTSSGTGANALFVAEPDGTFRDEGLQRGIVLPIRQDDPLGFQMRGVTFDDFDHDGDQDLLLLHWDTEAFGSKNDVGPDAAELGRGQPCNAVRSLDEDGLPARSPHAGPNRSRLFVNDGSGRFVDRTKALGLELDRVLAFTGVFHDMDDDGWSDLLITGDGCTSRLYRNVDGKRFVDVTSSTGVGTDENAMGSVVRDLNGDGSADWFVTSIGYPTRSGVCPVQGAFIGCSGNRLYLNRSDGTFTDSTNRSKVRNAWWGWGAAIEDFGNDGRLQIVVTNGYQSESDDGRSPPLDAIAVYFRRFLDDPLRFWIPRGARYSDAASLVGLDSDGISHGLVPFDYDNDGDLDLLIGRAAGQSPELYRNDLPPGRGWITVRLHDPTSTGNADAVGARIKVQVTPSSKPVIGWIATAGSYESQKPPEFHVGLNSSHEASTIEVWWPGESEPQVLRDQPADRRLLITRR